MRQQRQAARGAGHALKQRGAYGRLFACQAGNMWQLFVGERSSPAAAGTATIPLPAGALQ
jgi:hypothetical protein